MSSERREKSRARMNRITGFALLALALLMLISLSCGAVEENLQKPNGISSDPPSAPARTAPPDPFLTQKGIRMTLEGLSEGGTGSPLRMFEKDARIEQQAGKALRAVNAPA